MNRNAFYYNYDYSCYISYFNCNCWDLDFVQRLKHAPVVLVMRPWVKTDPMLFPPRLHFVFYVSPAAS